MNTLADHIARNGYESEGETVRAVFNAMNMPLPRDHEFTKGNDGNILFLNPAACVLRVQYEHAAQLHGHPNILAPLGRRIRGGLVFDVNPGIPCPASGRDMRRVRGILAEDNFDMWDRLTMNCGYLPAVAGLIKRKQIPVVLDPGAVNKLSNTIEEINALFPGMNLKSPAKETERPDLQKTLYAPLRDAFDAAWPANDALPDRGRMDDFWKKCAGFKKEGKLVASWLGWNWKFASWGLSRGHAETYKNTGGGAAYARRWNFPADF
jgi:hypothetical protein